MSLIPQTPALPRRRRRGRTAARTSTCTVLTPTDPKKLSTRTTGTAASIFTKSRLFLLLLSLAVHVPTTLQQKQQEQKHQAEMPLPYSCGMYLAQSTLPNAGLGIFTATERSVGDILPNRDVCFPILDIYWHQGYPVEPTNPFKDYFWAGRIMGMSLETDSMDIEALCPGLDCAINCHLPLTNVAKATPMYEDTSILENGSLHRAKDPVVGSFTPYHNGTTTVVTRDIPAGGELFKTYGDSWFTSRERIFGKHFPLTLNYPAAQELMQSLQETLAPAQSNTNGTTTTTPTTATSVSLLDNENFLRDVLYLILQINQGVWESRTLNALPKTLGGLQQVLQHDGDISVLHQPAAIRTLQDLAQTGKCLDHIAVGRSLLPQAGRGAFATRDLPAGTVITASPLHHVDESFMNMYNLTRNESSSSNSNSTSAEWLRHVDEVIGYQILINYCFAHDHSSIMLCPYGSGVNYINHNQSQANVKIAWATNFDYMHQQHIVESGTIEEDLLKTNKPVLAFDYLATRDIRKDEELYLDYGDLWEEAWQEHVLNYQPAGNDPERYVSARYWNNVLFPDAVLRTETEQEFDPYPENLQIRCHTMLSQRKSLGLRPPKRYHFDWTSITEYGYDCRILDRFFEHGEYWYTVELERESDNNEKKEKIIELLRRTDVPREAIRFFDKPGTTDMHLPNAFRHWIGIPDEIFPQQWRDYDEGNEYDDEYEEDYDGEDEEGEEEDESEEEDEEA